MRYEKGGSMEERRRFFFGEQRPRFPASKDTDFRRAKAPIFDEEKHRFPSSKGAPIFLQVVVQLLKSDFR
jgi:hypothetical protein